MPLDIHLKPVETLLFRSDVVAIGKFRCSATHPLYRDSGPCSHHTFVFPRTLTEIRHADGATFTGSPNGVAFYNQHQRYTRRQVSEIDASDWYTIADDVLFDLMARYDSRSARERPFRIAETTIDTSTFVLQRALFDSLREPHDAGRIEESVLAIVDRVLQRAYRVTPSIAPSHRRAAQHAQTLLARDPIANTPLRTIAAEAGVSLVQLCRAFGAQTGSTMTHYRHSLRLRLALDRLHTTDLSTLAQDLGYASHSHFTAVFRRHFHATPSAFRAKS